MTTLDVAQKKALAKAQLQQMYSLMEAIEQTLKGLSLEDRADLERQLDDQIKKWFAEP